MPTVPQYPMAFENREERQKTASVYLAQICNAEFSKVAHSDRGDPISLDQNEIIYKEMLNACKTICNVDMTILSEQNFMAIVQFIATFKQVVDVRLAINTQYLTNNMQAAVDSKSRLQSVYNEKFSQVMLILPYLVIRNSDYNATMNKICSDADAMREARDKATKTSQEILDVVTKSIQAKTIEFDSLIEDTKLAGLYRNTSKFADKFKIRADKFEKAADRWLYASWGTFGVTFIYLLTVAIVVKRQSIPVEWKDLIPHISIVAFLLGMGSWTSRNHRRNRHNQIISAHRADTLESFITIQSVFESKGDNREALLVKCVDNIFQPDNVRIVAQI